MNNKFIIFVLSLFKHKNMELSNEPIIEVIRKDGKLSSVKVIMPTWNELGEDNKIYTKMPMLGGIVTYAINELDADIAVKEAIHCFCVAADKFGMGLEKELESIGWNIVSKNDEHIILSIHSEMPAFELMLETGDTKALNIELEAA
jgi:hypothetical protein